MELGKDIGKERLYNRAFSEKGRNDVILWEVLEIEDGDLLEVTFLKKNSDKKQGIWFATDRGIEVDSNFFKQVNLWEDTAPKSVLIKCFTDIGKLSFYNIWDSGRGKQSQGYTSGMIVEEKDEKKIYYCNDIGFETNFNKLIFLIKKIRK